MAAGKVVLSAVRRALAGAGKGLRGAEGSVDRRLRAQALAELAALDDRAPTQSLAARPAPRPGPLPLNKVCDLADFAHPELVEALRDVFPHELARFGPGFPATVEYRKHWEVAMTARAFRAGSVLRPDAEVLGVGAGNEPTIFWLTQHVRRVFATDLYLAEGWGESANARMMLEPATQWPGAWNPRRLVVQHMNGLDLRYEDASFDGIFSSSSIEHFGTDADIARAVDEMFRVLKPGGVLSVATELRLAGPGKGFANVRMFDRQELLALLVGDRRWKPLDAFDDTLSRETLECITPEARAIGDVQRHQQAHGEIHFHRLSWSAYPLIVLERDGYRWTSAHVALQKLG
jgi:SAM-dependent methyltransferase